MPLCIYKVIHQQTSTLSSKQALQRSWASKNNMVWIIMLATVITSYYYEAEAKSLACVNHFHERQFLLVALGHICEDLWY